MAFAYWTIVAAAVLPYLIVAIAKGGGGYDNAAPRQWTEGLREWRQRAEWAHRNAFEAFAPFAAAVIVAGIGHARPGLVNALAAGFIVARVLHAACYIAGLATLRSVAWFAGFACTLWIFSAGILAMGG